MILDFHVHIGKTEKTNYFYSFKTYKKLMEENGISEALIMPNISSEIKASKLNESFLNNKLPYWGYPFIVIDPNDESTFNQMFDSRIYGVKFHPSISRVLIDNILMDKFWRICEEKKLLVLAHCGRDEISNIKYLITTSKKFSNVNFIGAHLGGNATDIIEKALEILEKEKLRNLYLDTSSGKFPDLIRLAVSKLGADKILFGSDVPYADLRISKMCVELCGVSTIDKKMIFYNNAKKLLEKRKNK